MNAVGYPTSLFQSRSKGIISRPEFITSFRQWQSKDQRAKGFADKTGTYVLFRGRKAKIINYPNGSMLEWKEDGDNATYAADTILDFMDMVNTIEADK